jgi:AcrR family transcriptional regulator
LAITLDIATIASGTRMRIVPYQRAARRRKRRTLDQQQAVKTALALLDEVGLDELTMRRLADRLDVKAAS